IDKLPSVTKQIFIARIGHAIHSDKTRLHDDVRVSGCLRVLKIIGKEIERLLQNARADRLGESNDNREALSTARGRILCSATRDGVTDWLGAQIDSRLADLRAGDSEHEGCCIAEVLDEIDGAGSIRQSTDSAEFERDV